MPANRLSARSLSTSGLKKDLAERLQAYLDAEASDGLPASADGADAAPAANTVGEDSQEAFDTPDVSQSEVVPGTGTSGAAAETAVATSPAPHPDASRAVQEMARAEAVLEAEERRDPELGAALETLKADEDAQELEKAEREGSKVDQEPSVAQVVGAQPELEPEAVLETDQAREIKSKTGTEVGALANADALPLPGPGQDLQAASAGSAMAVDTPDAQAQGDNPEKKRKREEQTAGSKPIPASSSSTSIRNGQPSGIPGECFRSAVARRFERLDSDTSPLALQFAGRCAERRLRKQRQTHQGAAVLVGSLLPLQVHDSNVQHLARVHLHMKTRFPRITARRLGKNRLLRRTKRRRVLRHRWATRWRRTSDRKRWFRAKSKNRKGGV